MKPIGHVWEHIRENWINGNRGDVRRIVTTLSKRDFRRLVLCALTYDFHNDDYENTQALSEILKNIEAYEE